ncbi:MAG: hypothetical protein Q9219_006468 [cf. Caloplaca sp. 3 TL-2023]
MTTRTTTTSSATSTSPTSTSTSATSTSTSTTSTSPTPTCPPKSYNEAVINGGFECGLAPWVAEDIVNTKHSLASPGDDSTFAYEFDQIGPKGPDADMHPAAVYQDIGLVSGVPYNLRFRTFFAKCSTGSEGFVGVMINRQPVYTVDACDKGAGAFKDNLVQFYAPADSTNLRFEFLTGENEATFKIDNVSVMPLH